MWKIYFGLEVVVQTGFGFTIGAQLHNIGMRGLFTLLLSVSMVLAKKAPEGEKPGMEPIFWSDTVDVKQ